MLDDDDRRKEKALTRDEMDGYKVKEYDNATKRNNKLFAPWLVALSLTKQPSKISRCLNTTDTLSSAGMLWDERCEIRMN